MYNTRKLLCKLIERMRSFKRCINKIKKKKRNKIRWNTKASAGDSG